MTGTRRVVVVDDEPFIARAVALALEADGFEVTICEHWVGVANTIRTELPHLVLLDYHMPTLKGDSICSILKRNGGNEGMKIVLFSSEAPSELVRIAAECGADGCIPKNTPPGDLVKRVRALTA